MATGGIGGSGREYPRGLLPEGVGVPLAATPLCDDDADADAEAFEVLGLAVKT